MRWRRERLKLANAVHDTPVAAQPTVAQLIGELESDRQELINIQEQLIATIPWRYLVLTWLLAIPITLVVIFGIAFPLDTGYYGVLVIGVPLLGLLVWAEARLIKKGCEPERASAARRRELKARVRQLEHELSRGQLEDGTEAPTGRKQALRRQPKVYAQRLWNRFPFLGPSPEVMLQRLPEGTSAPRLWFHRHLGWGTTAASALAVLILLFATYARAAGLR